MSRLMTSLRLYFSLVLITGLAYPLFITVLGAAFFPEKAKGSLVENKNTVVGSALFAQAFTNDRYFWPRPSAAGYATVASGASQLGPTSEKHRVGVVERIDFLRKAHPDSLKIPVPPELLTTSGSGLDPHLSPEGILFQLERVAKARKFSGEKTDRLRQLVKEVTETPLAGVIGERQVNVLLLNLKLDELQ